MDVNDLTIVLTNFGHTAGASAGGISAVAEPSTLLLTAAGLLGLLASRLEETHLGVTPNKLTDFRWRVARP